MLGESDLRTLAKVSATQKWLKPNYTVASTNTKVPVSVKSLAFLFFPSLVLHRLPVNELVFRSKLRGLYHETIYI